MRSHHDQTAADLAVDEYPDILKIRAVVSAQSEQVRNELHEALIARGLSTKEIEKRTGF